MLRIVVFDSGWGGSLFADYLEKEVKVFEVIREIDWTSDGYRNLSRRKIREVVELKLKEYIGKVDLIVLASYEISEIALEYLRFRYPEQKFMGFQPRLAGKLGAVEMKREFERELREYKSQLGLKRRIRFELDGCGHTDFIGALINLVNRGKRDAVLVLASDIVRKSKAYREDVKKISDEYLVLEPRCESWEKQIDESPEELDLRELPQSQNLKAVIIYGTAFMKVKDELKNKYGWKVKIYDDFQRSVVEICHVLDMRAA